MFLANILCFKPACGRNLPDSDKADVAGGPVAQQRALYKAMSSVQGKLRMLPSKWRDCSACMRESWCIDWARNISAGQQRPWQLQQESARQLSTPKAHFMRSLSGKHLPLQSSMTSEFSRCLTISNRFTRPCPSAGKLCVVSEPEHLQSLHHRSVQDVHCHDARAPASRARPLHESCSRVEMTIWTEMENSLLLLMA